MTMTIRLGSDWALRSLLRRRRGRELRAHLRAEVAETVRRARRRHACAEAWNQLYQDHLELGRPRQPRWAERRRPAALSRARPRRARGSSAGTCPRTSRSSTSRDETFRRVLLTTRSPSTMTVGPVCATLLDRGRCPVPGGRRPVRGAGRPHRARRATRPAAGAGSPPWSARPGVGKSRLAREAPALAADRGLLVLSGRAVPGGVPAAVPPAERGVAGGEPRDSRLPDAPELAGFGAQLARLVPDWGTPPRPAAPTTPRVLVGEAVVRLLRVLGGGRRVPARAGGPALGGPRDAGGGRLPRRHAHRRAGAVPGHDPAGAAVADRGPARPAAQPADRARSSRSLRCPTPSARRWCAACLRRGRRRRRRVPGFVAEHSDGLPFLVEELLAGLVVLRVRWSGRTARWRAGRGPRPSVPASFAESMRTRLQALDADARQVLAAAAVLGRRFDWDLLPGVAAVDGATAVDVAAPGGRRAARHGGRPAVPVPPRADPRGRARRAAPAGAVRALGAGARRGAAGAPRPARPVVRAGRRARRGGRRPGVGGGAHVESARRALARGALASAELTAERARGSLRPGPAVAADAEEVLVHDPRRTPGSPGRRGRSGTRCWAGSTSWARRRRGGSSSCSSSRGPRSPPATRDAAAADVEQARAVGDLGPGLRASAGRRRRARRAGPGPARRGRRLARGRGRAAAADRPEVECEALEVLGRLRDRRPSRVALSERAADLAERHGLTDLAAAGPAGAGPDRGRRATEATSRELRRVAADAGAHVTVAQMDLVLADIALTPSTATAAGRRRSAASTPAAATGSPASRGAALARRGACARRARGRDGGRAGRGAPPRPRTTRGSWPTPGAACARPTTRCARTGPRCARPLDRSMEFTRVAPETESVYPGQCCGRCCARCDDDLGLPARAEIAASPAWSGPGSASRARPDRRRRARAGRAAATTRAPLVDRAARRRDRLGRDWSWYSLRLVGRGRRPRRLGRAGRLAARGRGVLRRPRLRPGRPAVPGAARRGRAPRRSAAGAAGRPCPRPCAGSASPAGSSTCSSSSPTGCPPARSPRGCSSPRDGRAPRRQPVRPHRAPRPRAELAAFARANRVAPARLTGWSPPMAARARPPDDRRHGDHRPRDRRRHLPALDLPARRHARPASPSTSSCSTATSRCCSTPARGRCSRSWPRPWPGCCPSSGCAGSPSATSRPTSAAR